METFAQILPTLTALGAVVGFLFSFGQWIDLRRREERTKRYEQYHRAFERLAGRTADGHLLVDTQQAMAVYEIADFTEYRSSSLPIIEYYLMKTNGDPDDSLFRAALLHAKKALK